MQETVHEQASMCPYTDFMPTSRSSFYYYCSQLVLLTLKANFG